MAETININELNPSTFEFQTYSNEDTNLISSVEQNTSFDPNLDYIEYFIYSLNGNILTSNTSGYPNYTLLDNQLSINPIEDLKANGYEEGSYNTLYNFLSRKLGSSNIVRYYIEEISSDRTELRLNSTNLTSNEIIELTNEFINELNSVEGVYPDFYLNFDNNQLVIANNIQLDGETVLIKLYEPLPPQFTIKNELWVVEKLATSKAYNIEVFQTFDIQDENIPLQGPNLNISIKDNINNSTEYKTYSGLSTTTNSQGSGSLQYQLNNILAEKGIKINIDYTDYSNFIHFSSAQTRLENFYYKLGLIEEYSISSSYSSNPSSGSYYVSASNNIWQKKINEIITGFDGYENYLYFESGSKTWPKTNSTPPYTNSLTTSTPGQNFLVTQSLSASLYDQENDNALINTVPEYLREDSQNDKYELFVEMLGQQFDNIYLHIQSVTDKFDADNRLNYGISKDLVADVIRDLGVKIYQNNFSVDDLYIGLLGITPSGSLLGLPDTTGSLPTPTGIEYIDTYITASDTGSLYPTSDVNKSIYKRIYHNLPYLLKKKGTIEGLRTLINIYGIPDTILRISEFGGKDKNNSNDWDLWQEKYNFAFSNSGSGGHVDTAWELNSNWDSQNNHPETVAFRFKALPSSSFTSATTQSLWTLDHPIGDADVARLVLEYDADFTSGSYSGSIANTGSQYANLKFYITNNSSSGITLPFINNGWWSVMVTRNTNDFTIHAGNKIYNGDDGYQIGFYTSSTFTSGTTDRWQNSTSSYFPPTRPAEIPTGTIPFTGSYQEIRYYNEPLSEATFKDYIMNPYSIEGTSTTGSYNQLVFRASLGGELYTGSTSIHPKVTGSSITQSFTSDSNFNITDGSFVANRETFFYDQFPAGMRNRNSNKIKKSSVILPTSSSQDNIPNADVLSPFQTIQQNSYVSESYTADIDYVEVAFSPQNEINDDIISQLGYFNVGEYIGDPRQISSSNTFYPDLNTLRDAYFEKYTHNYNLWDYIRLIKYLDNSLFKMIKDFTPARTGLASGIVVKQHLLERNKYPLPQATKEQDNYYTGSINVSTITGSNGGSMPELNGQVSGSGPGFNISPITQSWSGTNPSISGSVSFTQEDQSEFFNGELSGSDILVTNGELNIECIPFKSSQVKGAEYIPTLFLASTSNTNEFLNEFNVPPSGSMYLLYDDSDDITELPSPPGPPTI